MRESSEQRFAASAVYWLGVVGIYVLEGALWYYPFKEKVFDDGLIAPAPVKEQFAGSLIDSFPGTSVAWGALGLLQGVVVLLLLASLARGEFLPQRAKWLLLSALTLSLVVFALLVFGESMTAQYESVASLFAYFGLSVVLIGAVRLLPPYRPLSWLSGEAGR